MYSFRSRRFLRRSLMEMPVISLPGKGSTAPAPAAGASAPGLASKLAMRCRSTETK